MTLIADAGEDLYDDRNVLQKAVAMLVFAIVVVVEGILRVLRVPFLLLITPAVVPYLLIRRLMRGRSGDPCAKLTVS